MKEEKRLHEQYALLLPHLNERDSRLTLAAEAISLGFGGITKVFKATGVARSTITTGIHELKEKKAVEGRIRRHGGGRKKQEEKDTTLISDLDKIIEPTTRGDPESPLRWTTKSMMKLAKALSKRGHQVSHTVVGRIIKGLGYSLQSLRKRDEGKQHPDRDGQFRHITEIITKAIEKGIAVVSVDAKKKELVGEFKHNHGKEWQRKRQPEETNAYDFPSVAKGKAKPYGVYDVKENVGFVNVGISRDTAKFAVASIKKWWETIGKKLYAHTEEIIITADSGGSNSNRARLWKWELQQFANEMQKSIHVLHFPPGTSKWNKIEHRLFSYISLNWRGRTLATYEIIIQLISNTTTKTGLKVYAAMDWHTYQKGIKITDKQMKQINITSDIFHPEWNYTIHPNV